ncbi:AAA family ATPase [Paratractidigestivibacter sp.]|uniref:AAA family ATPase n=1 Tax=Paratractidigestivibacter sp. TaxID=2847316 RepID=UPI002AC9C2C2|nr:AAA family ATPase [Paratractidigestivibacter sp.]
MSDLNVYFDVGKGQYIKTRKPYATTPDRADALTYTSDTATLNLDPFYQSVLDAVESWSANTASSPKQIVLEFVRPSDGARVYQLGICDSGGCEINGVPGSANPNEESAIMRMSLALRMDVLDIFMRTAGSPSLTGIIADMSAALGISKPSMAAGMDEDKLLESIKQNTKAEVVKPSVTLDDYVCNDLLREELEEIVSFFNERDQYTKANVEIPRGVLFKGPPGTGKTYAAKCIAGTVNCYFMSCTASAVQGMYVGSGSDALRKIFQGARTLAEKSKKGVIVFMDELDSFGSRQQESGAADELSRTINQLLAEMDGFAANENIMVMGATNFPESLDGALMRAGRFGRQITIDYPDEAERAAMLKHYFGKIALPLETPLTSDDFVPLTKNMTPAMIKDIANESAIKTVRAHAPAITMDVVNEAVNRTISKNVRHPDKDAETIRLVSAHESGHALAEVMYLDALPVKMTSYSYGDAGGFTQNGSENASIPSQGNVLAKIKMLLAGRVAEQVVMGYVTTGASNDISRAQDLMTAYYEDYLFEPYKASELEQVVLDRLGALREEVRADFEKHKDTLVKLTDELVAKRVMYAMDISLAAGALKGIYKC